METSTSLRIGIQKKGRLTDETVTLLKNIGLEFDGYKNRLMVRSRNFDVEILLIRDDDIPEYVQDGVCDIGFVGANVTAERDADVQVLLDLNFGHCHLSLAAPKSSDIRKVEDFQGKRVATSYPRLTRRFFESQGLDVEIITISGAVEITPALDVADAICDLVSTGSTLKANGLIELDTILESQTQLIQTSKSISQGKQDLIDKFLVRIQGQQAADESRYIMMNAPRASLEKISHIIPSLNSPTVLPLANPDMIAIHSVISIREFWVVMEKLKEAGATGIVMLPIQNMIL
ncbi:MAG TPA: ATP phosphoribosyltransferase [Balneolales bacterium]|nr:ATP phosphoribosyltransferase [Balneolales bacterium]